MTNKEAINILINCVKPPIIRNDGKSVAHLLALEAILKAVIALEAADVVRCKDCKFNFGVAHNCEFNPHDIVCTYWETDGLGLNDFCSYGVERERVEE